VLPCGTYEGIPHDASINGQCMLPDGEARSCHAALLSDLASIQLDSSERRTNLTL